MKFRRLTAILLILTLALGLFPIAVSAKEAIDLSDCRLTFDGEDWKVYTVENKADALDPDDMDITLTDGNGEVVPKNAYDLVFGTYRWDDEAEENIFEELSAPLSLSPHSDYMQAGFGDFAAYAVAKENSGYTGSSEICGFMLWHKYSFNYFGAQITFGDEFKGQSTWFWHDFYELPEDSVHAPSVFDITGEEVSSEYYTMTFYTRNTEIPDPGDPDYEKKIYPDTEPLEGMPTELGAYYVRVEGKAPYYGSGCIDFDIVEPEEPRPYATVRGSERLYFDGDTIYIPEGGEAYITFGADPWPDGLFPGWRNDLLEEDGFTVDPDPVYFEGDDSAYAHVKAGELPAGSEGTLYYNWYSYEDIFVKHIPWSEAPTYMTSSVKIRVGEEPDPETFAFICGEEDMRYYNGDTILIRNGEDILLTFDLTYYPDFLLCDRNYDGVREAGFTVVQEIVSFEDAGYKYVWLRAEDLEPGTRATIPLAWYLFDDYFDKDNHDPVYVAEISVEVADEPAGYILGDADSDGETDIIDATIIQRVLADIPVYAFSEAAADVNRSGEADIDDAAQIQRFESAMLADSGFSEPGVYGTYYAGWNINERLLPEGSTLEGAERVKAEAEIRTALSLLVDRRQLSEVTGIERLPASSFVSDYVTDPDGEWFISHSTDGDFYGYFDVNDYDHNRAEAIEILKQYYDFDETSGKFTNAPALSYICNQGTVHEAIGNWIADTYAALGIGMEVKSVSWDKYSETLDSGNFSIAREGWVVDYDDPLEFLYMFTADCEDNSVHYGMGEHAGDRAYSLDLHEYGIDYSVENGTWAETYDVLIGMIRACRSAGVRSRLCHLAEDMLMDSGCILPLYYY